MSSAQQLLLTTVVTRAQWDADDQGVLQSAQATMRQRAQQRGLDLLGEPEKDIEVLTGSNRVRITLSAQATPSAQGARLETLSS